MTPEERDLITGLFTRLRGADTQAHDTDAERLISQAVASQPAAPYLMAQTVLVQEHALANAQARIAQLERQLAVAASNTNAQPASGGSFLSGLFGGKPASPAPASQVIPARSLPGSGPATPSASYPSTVNMPSSAGGTFLRSALSTAAGVAGGALLFEGIENLLGHRSGAFGSSFGGGGGGFGGGGFSGGQPEVIENNEVVNNYYGEPSGRHSDASATDPGALGNDPAYDTPPTDDPGTTNDPSTTDDPAYDTPPTDDPSSSDSVDDSSDPFASNDDFGGSDVEENDE